MFGLGVPELLIIGLCGTVPAVVAVALVVASLTRKRRDRPGGG